MDTSRLKNSPCGTREDTQAILDQCMAVIALQTEAHYQLPPAGLAERPMCRIALIEPTKPWAEIKVNGAPVEPVVTNIDFRRETWLCRDGTKLYFWERLTK